MVGGEVSLKEIESILKRLIKDKGFGHPICNLIKANIQSVQYKFST